MTNLENCFLIGLKVTADHPITVMNPTKDFIIKQVRIENDRISVRGEHTCWFNHSMIKLASTDVAAAPVIKVDSVQITQLTINGRWYNYNTIESALTDKEFHRIIDTCGHHDTDEGWKKVFKSLEVLVSEHQQTGNDVESECDNPKITIKKL